MSVRYSDQTTTTVAEVEVPLPGVSVHVYDSHAALATLTADGGGPLPNPFLSDGQGNYAFNVATAGLYDLKYYYGGKLVLERNGVLVGSILGVLPPEVSLSGKYLAFDVDGNAIGSTGTGTDAGLRTDLAASSGSSLVGFNRGVTGSVTRSLFAQVRDNRVNPYEFGAVGDGVTANDTAIANAFAAIKAAAFGSGFYRGGLTLSFPPGKFLFANTIEHKGVTHIFEGQGSGQAGGNATSLIWPANKCGIRVHRYNTLGAGLETVPTQGSDSLIIRNLMLQGSGGTATDDSSGIWARCRIRVQDVCVDSFAGNGILFRATQGSGTAAQEGNANSWRVDTVRLTNNGKSGLRLIGADVNAGLSTMVDASSNAEWGINDGSFLGNRHLGHHMEANGLGPWTATDSNAMCHFGGYTEPGQPNSVAGPNTTWDGPQFVPVTSNGGSGLRANGLDGGGFGSSNGFYAKRSADGVNFLKHIMGCDPTNHEYDNFFSPGGMKFGFTDFGDDFGVSVESVFEAFRIKNGFTPQTFGRAANTTTRGAVQFQTGFFLGAGSSARHLTLDAGVPGSVGDFAEGEIVFQLNPSTTKAMAAVCYTGSGTTPTWYKAATIFIDGSATYDPPSIAAAGTTTTTVTATGAALGDIAQASFSLALGGLMMAAEVSAANTVTVRLFNPTGGAIDLASGTLRVRVSKA